MLDSEVSELGILGNYFLINSALGVIVSELGIRYSTCESPSQVPTHASVVLISFDAIDDLLSDMDVILSRSDSPPRLILFPRFNDIPVNLPKLPKEVAAVVHPKMGHAEIKSIIILVMEGHKIVPFGSQNNPLSKNTLENTEITQEVLTRRQREILREVAKGQTNKEIARSLKISTNTVEAHVSCIIRKLNVQNRTQAALALNDPLLSASVPVRTERETQRQQA